MTIISSNIEIDKTDCKHIFIVQSCISIFNEKEVIEYCKNCGKIIKR